MPPSIRYCAPVMKRLSSEARNNSGWGVTPHLVAGRLLRVRHGNVIHFRFERVVREQNLRCLLLLLRSMSPCEQQEPALVHLLLQVLGVALVRDEPRQHSDRAHGGSPGPPPLV